MKDDLESNALTQHRKQNLKAPSSTRGRPSNHNVSWAQKQLGLYQTQSPQGPAKPNEGHSQIKRGLQLDAVAKPHNMPSTTRRQSSPAQEEEEMEDQEMEDESGARLQFKQPLSWRAGRPIAVADLLRRLETLSKELQTYDQDEVEKDSLATVAKELVSQQLIAHKDRGVKAYAAACLVDIFRLCAPDAPYTGTQLKVSSYVEFNNAHAYDCLGYLHALRAIHLPSAGRPIQPIQRTAFTRPQIIGRSQIHNSSHRHPWYSRHNGDSFQGMLRCPGRSREGQFRGRAQQKCRTSYDGCARHTDR